MISACPDNNVVVVTFEIMSHCQNVGFKIEEVGREGLLYRRSGAAQ